MNKKCGGKAKKPMAYKAGGMVKKPHANAAALMKALKKK